LSWLNERGMIHPKIRELVLPIINTPFLFQKDILERLQKDPKVWNNYRAFSDSYKRIRVAYIEAARNRPEEFEKRLENFLSKTRQNKRIRGYGGVEKYYQ